MSKIKHVVEQGDCISKLAVEYGLTWDQIWDDPANKKLKKLRKDPNVLLPGDVVKIPNKKNKKKNKGTGQKHSFKRNKEQSKLKIQLKVAGEPIKNQTCKFEVIGYPTLMGRTDGDGNVAIEGETEIPIPSKVTKAELIVGDEPQVTRYKVKIGHLNPIDEMTGVQQRLNNLGYECGAVDGVHGLRTDDAIKRLHLDNKLKYIPYSFNVKLEGKSVTRTTDLLLHNHGK